MARACGREVTSIAPALVDDGANRFTLSLGRGQRKRATIGRKCRNRNRRRTDFHLYERFCVCPTRTDFIKYVNVWRAAPEVMSTAAAAAAAVFASR